MKKDKKISSLKEQLCEREAFINALKQAIRSRDARKKTCHKELAGIILLYNRLVDDFHDLAKDHAELLNEHTKE